MSAGLALRSTLDRDTMWRAMRQLLERVFGVLDRETVFDDSLDILVDLLGADRGQVLVIDAHGKARTIHARAGGREIGGPEREEVSSALIARARESGECVTWDASSLMTASSSIYTLGIRAALAAPLRGTSQEAPTTAVLYVDVRSQEKHLGQSHVEFFMAAALLIGALVDERTRGERDRARLREALTYTTDTRRKTSLDDLVGRGMLAGLSDEIREAVASELPLLILGESGTGKTLLAHAVAEASGRRPIVRATLGGSDDLNTITSELFGHERGAFSGASGRRAGLVEYASGGTLILDELLNLPTHAQKLLLDFTQFGTYRPLGYNRAEAKHAKVRIIAATNGDLTRAVRSGRFREDLYHRLAGLVVDLPPLRQRRAEVPVIAEQMLRRADPERPLGLSAATRSLLASSELGWSGNVRQLERVIARARERALGRDPGVRELVPEHFEARDLDGVSLTGLDARANAERAADAEIPLASSWQRLQADRARIDELEAALIRRAFSEVGGVVAQAARSLGIARTTLSSRLEALGMRTRRTLEDV